MAGHVDVAVQALVVRLAHTVVDGSCDLDRVREVSEPAGGDTGPETNSREVFLYLCNQWSILLPRNLRGFLQQFGWAWKDVGTCAPGIMMKPRSEPVDVSSGGFIVQEAA